MALITCPDCERSISDAAPTCPGCGRAMRVTTVVELTDKKYKRLMLGGVAIFVLGFVVMGIQNMMSMTPLFGVLVVLAGIVFYVGASLAAWWNNG